MHVRMGPSLRSLEEFMAPTEKPSQLVDHMAKLRSDCANLEGCAVRQLVETRLFVLPFAVRPHR